MTSEPPADTQTLFPEAPEDRCIAASLDVGGKGTGTRKDVLLAACEKDGDGAARQHGAAVGAGGDEDAGSLPRGRAAVSAGTFKRAEKAEDPGALP